MVGMVGIEPTLEVTQKVFETFASANSATSPIDRMPSQRSAEEDSSVPVRGSQI